MFGGIAPTAAGAALQGIELHDTIAGTWRRSAANGGAGLATRRYGHTATRLPSGAVLVAGGGDDRAVWHSAEIYDPLTDTVVPSAVPLQVARQHHTATPLANGNVLLAGGFSLALGGISATGLPIITSSMEVYDVPSGTFQLTTATLTRERCHHTALALGGGDVVLAGGYVMPGVGMPWCPTTALSDRFTPDLATSSGALGTLAPTAPLVTPRMNHTCTNLGTGVAQGLALVVGGFTTTPFSGVLASAEVFDPAAPLGGGLQGDYALLAATLSESRRAHSATMLTTGADAGQLLVVGGAAAAPSQSPPLALHGWHSAHGGACGHCAARNTAELLDPFGNGQLLTQPFRGVDLTAAVRFTTDAAGARTEMSGTTGGALPGSGRYFHSATALPSGHVLLIGGWDCPPCAPGLHGPETALATCEVYNP